MTYVLAALILGLLVLATVLLVTGSEIRINIRYSIEKIHVASPKPELTPESEPFKDKSIHGLDDAIYNINKIMLGDDKLNGKEEK